MARSITRNPPEELLHSAPTAPHILEQFSSGQRKRRDKGREGKRRGSEVKQCEWIVKFAVLRAFFLYPSLSIFMWLYFIIQFCLEIYRINLSFFCFCTKYIYLIHLFMDIEVFFVVKARMGKHVISQSRQSRMTSFRSDITRRHAIRLLLRYCARVSNSLFEITEIYKQMQ